MRVEHTHGGSSPGAGGRDRGDDDGAADAEPVLSARPAPDLPGRPPGADPLTHEDDSTRPESLVVRLVGLRSFGTDWAGTSTFSGGRVMCNAWNHDDDCACGFGPPYPWRILPAKRTRWIDAALLDERRFARALHEMGLDARSIKEDLHLYRSRVASGFAAGQSRGRLKSWLLRIIRRREYRTERSRTAQIDVPLFKLHSPAVRGSKATYQEKSAEEARDGWWVTIVGTGMGATQTVRVEYATKFISENGDYKAIFVPVILRVSLIAIYEKGRLQNRRLRTEVDRSTFERAFNKGVKLLSSGELVKDMALTRPKAVSFRLAGDTSQAISTFERTWMVGDEVKTSLGVKMFKIGTTMEVGVRREEKLTLTFDLPGGRDYHLLRLSREHGVVWKVGRTTHGAASPRSRVTEPQR